MQSEWSGAAVLLPLVLLLGANQAQGGSATLSGASNLMNPALSVNGLVLGQVASEDTSAMANGARLQEVELHATAIVDPFWTADVIFSVAPAGDASGYEISLEVASIDATQLPGGSACVSASSSCLLASTLPCTLTSSPSSKRPPRASCSSARDSATLARNSVVPCPYLGSAT